MARALTFLFLLSFGFLSAQMIYEPTLNEELSFQNSNTCQPEIASGNYRTMAEWEELEAIVITWNAFPTILTEIVRAAQKECKVIIIASNISSVLNALSSSGIDPHFNTEYIQENFNSLWIRDYGPTTVYENNVEDRFLVDWIYNRNRPEDDQLSMAIASQLSIPLICLTESPNDLVHVGGNFMSDGIETGFSTKILLEENGLNNEYGQSNHVEEDIDRIMSDYMGINRYIKMDTLPFDRIHHMDMHMKLLDETTLMVGSYPEGVADGPQIESNLEYIMSNFPSPSGHPYQVVRIEMPGDENGQYPPEGKYRTYTNALIINKSILIPTYGIPADSIALSIWQNEMPGYNLVSIDCNSIVEFTAAIHCITKEIGVDKPFWISHSKPPLACTDEPTTIKVNAAHSSGVESLLLNYWTNTNPYPQQIPMSLFDGENDYRVELSLITQIADTLYYYFEGLAQNGKQIARPLPAPEAFFKIPIGLCKGVGIQTVDEPMNDLLIYPNPASDQLYVEIESDFFFDKSTEVFVVDIEGKNISPHFELQSSTAKNTISIFLPQLKSGLYFLMVKKGAELFSERFFIKKP